MAILEWDLPGDRLYETGLDRGVLYPSGKAGVVWNGLISVDENVEGASVRPYYLDGVKTHRSVLRGDFQANIQAYTYPDAFEEIQGYGSLSSGGLASGQPPQTFGLSYRTRLGNDISGSSYAYRLNLIYNALVVPTPRSYQSMNNNVSPTTFTWSLTTKPVRVPGFAPTAHVVFDPRHVSLFAMTVLERILYGYFEDPRLPTPEEMEVLPLSERQVIVVGNPDPALLPSYAKEGDLIFSTSDHGVYSIGEPSDRVRPIFVLPEADESLLPDTAYPGDLVYVEPTGKMYKVGE